ncbi:MAG: YceI family protein [Ilumatobacter sp.]
METTPEPARTGGARRRLLIILGAVVALIAIGYGAIIFYAQVINDAPEALDSADLEAALAATTTEAAETSTTVASENAGGADDTDSDDSSPTTTAASSGDSDVSGSDEAATGDTDGLWVIGAGSELGYRVAEVLFGVPTEGVGRTDQVTGELRLDGTVLTEATFTVDVATITSDDGRRDNQFRGRIMSASEFPTATFTLTSPADLGVEATEGASVTTAVSGDLTLRGVTLPVEVAVEARITDGRLGVLGTVPVVFTDFGIADPSITGITVEPDGLIEFLLVLDPA